MLEVIPHPIMCKGIGSLMTVRGSQQRMQAQEIMMGKLMERYGILIARIVTRLLP